MRTEQKIFNDLIETIVNNSENNEAKITNVELWAKSWKEEMKQALTLTDVSNQRELFYNFITWYNAKPKVEKNKDGLVTIGVIDEFLKL